MLNAAFNKAEIAFLIEKAKFRTALAEAKDTDDFQSLCCVAQGLLSQKEFVASSTSSSTVRT